MKTLPSMSGLLPAQFKSDHASIGIGWSTINPSRDKEDLEVENTTLVVDKTLCESAYSNTINVMELKPTESNVEPTTVNDSDIIRVGDVVYVKLDHKNECGDTLKAGGVYVVREVGGVTLRLRGKHTSYVSHYGVKKIKDKSKVIVSTTINNGNTIAEGEIVATDLSNMPILIKTKYGVCFWCHEDDVFLKEDNQ